MISVIKRYWGWILSIFVFSVATNGLSLLFPKKVGVFVDAYKSGTFSAHDTILSLVWLSVVILLTAFIQFIISTYASEKIGREYRQKIISALQGQSLRYVRETTAARLITTLTSDVDAVKNLVASGIVSILTAIVTLIGAVIFLLSINWKLALITLSVIPVLMFVFSMIMGKAGKLFGMSQINLDRINKTINESIISAPLIRVLNARNAESKKFEEVNKASTDIARGIVRVFASLIPIVVILSNVAILLVLWFGGKQVIGGTLSIGQMSAFFSYTSVFIYPFFILSFASTFISRANVSLKRIQEVLEAKGSVAVEGGNHQAQLKGGIVFDNVTLSYSDKIILKDISFEIKPGTKTAIVGPTGAGKTELFYLVAGLTDPTMGKVLVDGVPTSDWNQSSLLSQIGLVFQDSVIFNTTLRENVVLNDEKRKVHTKDVKNEDQLTKALNTSELEDLVASLPQGIETIISERGTTLSGGQKQRVMLARALSSEPSLLLLDDFTARVDIATEGKIIDKLNKNYKNLTLVSITQKIEPIKKYDHIIVLMEGELIAQGSHDQLMKCSIEYQQIYASQQTTEH